MAPPTPRPVARRDPAPPPLLAALAFAAAFAGATSPATAAGQDIDPGLELSIETRVFPAGPGFDGQAPASVSPSLVVGPEAVVERADGRWRLSAEGFLRVDAHDPGRTHVDVRELGVAWRGVLARAFVGAGRVFWGVTEVRHLVDIVNQSDAVEDPDEEQKLGQPMVRVTVDGGWGALDAMVMPWFRERTYPAQEGRLRAPLPVSGSGVYESRHGRWNPDVAARWYRPTGPLDLGLSFFRGTSREPRLIPRDDGLVLVPHYDIIDQVAVDAQWTGEATLLKLEAISRGGQGRRFAAATAGVEHTLYGVLGSASDLGLLVEAMVDGRSAAAPATPFDHDVFLGARWARNDASATALLAGAVVDWEHGETLAMVEADRRLGPGWTAGLEARLFAGTEPGRPAHALRRDGFVTLRLTRFF